MKQRKNYASRLTKEMLEKSGIDLITEDGYVFRNGKQVMPIINKKGYLMLSLYDLDEDGNKIKKPITRTFKGCKKPTNTYVYKLALVGLHRAMWAWIYGEVPEGYVIDHISNKHDSIEDYHISNLQMITQRANVAKERGESNKQVKCKLDRPLSYYEDKLKGLEERYEAAKKAHDAELVHKLRSNLNDTRARIRYYLAHKEEADMLCAEKAKREAADKFHSDVYRAKAQCIKLLKDIVKTKRAEYDNALETNGSKHETTLSLKAEWKRARKELNAFEGEVRETDKAYLPELINNYVKRALSNF